MSDNTRIAKNTMFLYLRMGIIMLVKLYIARVLLEALGIADYGIWNLIASFVVSFQFVSSPIVSSTQRYLNYDMGQGGKKLTDIFNLSLELIIVVSVILIVGLETVGRWFLDYKMQFPPDKVDIAHILYQLTIITLVFQLLQKPFESTVIAHERMSFYAYISLFEAAFLLGITLLIKSDISANKLVWYGWLNFALYLCEFLCYLFFCRSKFRCCRFKLTWEKKLAKEIVSFSGWNLFGGLSSMTANQGVNVLLNIFFGVTVNAAFGVSQQVKSAINTLVGNLQKAFDPQIVKNYASGNTERLHFLTFTIIRLSYILALAVIFPLIFNFEFILKIWLGNTVPHYAYIFSVLTLIQMLFVAMGGPIDTAIFATGKIKSYQLWLSGEIFLNIIIIYGLFKLNFGPASAFVTKTCVELLILFTRFIFLRRINIDLKLIVKKVVYPLVLVTIGSGGICFLFFGSIGLSEGYFRAISSTLIFLILLFILSWYLILDKNMRHNLITKLKRIK